MCILNITHQVLIDVVTCRGYALILLRIWTHFSLVFSVPKQVVRPKRPVSTPWDFDEYEWLRLAHTHLPPVPQVMEMPESKYDSVPEPVRCDVSSTTIFSPDIFVTILTDTPLARGSTSRRTTSGIAWSDTVVLP
jgi:hypothetical protein